jgi:ABC transporter substrate binding protein (PQQ-dependent alcohol dehydrogenase system)
VSVTRFIRPIAICAAALALGVCQAAVLQVTVIERADNPDWARDQLERAYLGHTGGPALDGVRVALDEAKFELESQKAGVNVNAESVATLESARAAAQKAEKAGANALVVNLPQDWLVALAKVVKIPVFNVGASADALREKECSAQLLHTLPSERMRADALAQALLARRWTNVLVLVGPAAKDIARSAGTQAALKRFGLKVVATKSFKLSADPRERHLGNPLLLTANLSYDVVWVVDSEGEFARGLPFNTSLPRPVVGDAGLVALAWHPQYERYGAPQVSRRFSKLAKRPMTDHDWAAWMAGKALVAVALTAARTDAVSLRKALVDGALDGSKGMALQFRQWDGQLRQTMLLTDGQGVVATLPLEGIMHPRNSLDTLGGDEPEKLCNPKP